jgi:glycerol-3-phosphate dehydrogenase
MPDGDFERFLAEMRVRYHWLEPALLQRYARAYGTRMQRVLEGCLGTTDLGAEVLPGLHEREIAYLRSVEFAVTAEDILFRRSKLGVHLGAGSVTVLDDWLARN